VKERLKEQNIEPVPMVRMKVVYLIHMLSMLCAIFSQPVQCLTD